MGKQKVDRVQEAVKVAAPGRVQEARRAGPHGSVTQADGSKQSEKNLHKPLLRGKPGLDGLKNKD
jgi:hypothetical protein